MPDDARQLHSANPEAADQRGEATGAYTKQADEAGLSEAGPGSKTPATEGPGSRIGPYKLLQEIGEGGMGTVFMAEQLEPVRRMVALKVIKLGMDSKEVLARFEAERQALALMDHPNIAKVLDSGTTDSGRPYFGMELVKGVRITKYCDELQLSLHERLKLFVPVCQAIQHAHQKGIIHRDIKPSNVLVASYDGKPVPKVIDFGVAKAMGQKLTERTMFTAFGLMIGTLEYMSPEQAELNALDIDTRSDIYSLGVLLYRLLTGTTPLSRKRLKEAALAEALRLIREEEPPKPSTRLSSSEALPVLSAQRRMEPAKMTKMMRGELDWIVMKALEKDRSRRYETANGFARDIERFLHNEPVEACPPSAGYRFRKLAQRYKTPLRVAGAFFVLLILAVIVSAWQATRATQEAGRATQAEEAATAERDRAVLAEKQTQLALAETRKAKTEAESSLTEANEARREAQAVADYLVKVIGSPNPATEGRPEKVVDVLDRMAADLDVNFSGSPATKAELFRALGWTYRSLGLFDKAAGAIEQEHAIHSATNGPDHLFTLQAGLWLAVSHRDAGRLDVARPMLEKTLQKAEALFGHEHFFTVIVMNQLGGLYAREKRTDIAVPMLQEALRLSQGNSDVPETERLWTMSALANAYRIAGRFQESIELYHKTVNLFRVKISPNHPHTLHNMHSMADAYWDNGQLVEAIKLLEETLTLSKAKLGPDVPGTLRTTSRLASAYRDVGRIGEAESMLREVLAIREKNIPDGWVTFEAKSWLGGNLLAQKKYAEAEPLLLQGYKGMKEREASIDPQDSLRVVQALQRIVQLYEATSQPDELAKWRKELEAAKKKEKETKK